MPAADFSIVDEVETAINTGSAERCLEAIRRVTDLFLSSDGAFNGEQVELFDNVLERLIKTIEIRAIADVSARIALAEMSSQFAVVAQAPPSVVRRLARNDEIAVAGPVLAESARLSAEDLVEIAQTKGEQHLLAISGRWWLKEVVTDALLSRRYPTVSRRIINNPGARVSAAGFAIVLGQAESDPELAVETGIRVDLPEERHLALTQVKEVLEAREAAALVLLDVVLGQVADEVARHAHVEEELALAAPLVEREGLARPDQVERGRRAAGRPLRA